MCVGGPDIPDPVTPPAPPPVPLEKEQLKPLLIGKERKREKNASISSLRRDLTQNVYLGGTSGGGELL